MPPKLTKEDLRIAYTIYKDGLQVLDPYDNEIISTQQISAENAIIKVESFNNLSAEAREVIDVILNAPSEILDVMGTPKQRIITRRSVFKHLSKIFRSRFIARLIIKEIQEWVNQL